MPLDPKAEEKADKPAKKRVPPLTDDQVREALAMASCGIASDPRKEEAWNRWLVFTENFRPLVAAKVAGTHDDKDTINRICRFTDVSVNLALDMMDQTCVVWDKPATRHIGLKPSEPPEDMQEPAQPPGAPPPFGKPAEPQEGQEDDEKEAPKGPPKPPALNGLPAPPVQPPKPKPKPKSNPQTDALRKLYREHLQVDAWFQDLNKLAWWLVRVVVVPKIAKGRARADVLLPYFYDPILDPEDPQGKPIGYAYTVRRHDTPKSLLGTTDPNVQSDDIVILDSESWRTFRREPGNTWEAGKEIKMVEIEEVKHGLGYVPAVELAFSRPLDGTPFGDFSRHRRLYDATITCSLIATKLAYIRKSQDRKLFTAVGNIDQKKDDGQTPDPDTGVAFNADNPALLQIQALDFDTPPTSHIQHIAFHYNKAASAYGGKVSEGMGMAGSIAPSVEFSSDAQTEIRVDQIPYARDFEREFAAVVCDLVKQNKAGFEDPELADALPDPDEVREEFSVQFAPLSRKFASFAEEQAFMEFQKANGLASQYDFARRQDPDLSDEQARDFVLRKLEEAAEVNDIAAKRNLPMDGEGVKDISEIQGKAGPQVRDNPSNPDEGPPDGEPKDDE